jgi:DNA-binding CsgD family transcriptional regulator
MLRCDDDWLRLADDFYHAAVDPNRWYAALDGLARATASKSGELICFKENAAPPVSLATNVDPEALVDFAALDGGNPEVNPRVDAGFKARVLEPLAESDFITPAEHAQHPHYVEFAHRWDIPYCCLTTLHREPGAVFGLSVLRSRRQGHIDSEQKAVFASLAPHVRAAVRMQRALGENAAAVLTGSLEALSMVAFVCDGNGRVYRMTKQAESLVSRASALQLRNQRLRASSDSDDRALSAAVEAAGRGVQVSAAPPLSTVVVRGADAPLLLEVMPLLGAALEAVLRPLVVIIARGRTIEHERKGALLKSVYGLTAAEAEVALQLARGEPVEAIAQMRQVAVGTVRVQIKSLLAKLGVRRQAELVARLNRF